VVTIFDDSLRAVDLALWGKAFIDRELKEGDILVLRRGKVSTYLGISVNVDSENSEVFINDKKLSGNQRVQEVSQWYSKLL